MVRKQKSDLWKTLTIIALAWLFINTYYLSVLSSRIAKLSTVITQSPLPERIEIPTSSTAIKTGYFLLAYAPLMLGIVFLGLIVIVLLVGNSITI